MSKDAVPPNLRSSPMTYEVLRAPSLFHQRETLATDAEGLTVEELKSRATEAQFDLSGASTKEAMVQSIRAQARGIDPSAETA